MPEIEKAEVERVDFIHAELDRSAKWYLQQHPSYDGALFVVPPYNSLSERTEHEFSAAEVRDWPKVKAALVALLLGDEREAATATFYSERLKRFVASKFWDLHENQDHFARGLVCYRQSRIYLEATGQAEQAKAWFPQVGERVRVKPSLPAGWAEGKFHTGQVLSVLKVEGSDINARIYGAPGHYLRPDDVEPADALADRLDAVIEAQRTVNGARVWDSDKYNGITAAAFASQSNLDKRIAAAKELLDRPIEGPRFPHEGRNFCLTKRDHE